MKPAWMPWPDTSPPRGRLVLVQIARGESGEAPAVGVGYMKFAAGDAACPYFVVPGARSSFVVSHWADCHRDHGERRHGGAVTAARCQRRPACLPRQTEEWLLMPLARVALACPPCVRRVIDLLETRTGASGAAELGRKGGAARSAAKAAAARVNGAKGGRPRKALPGQPGGRDEGDEV